MCCSCCVCAGVIATEVGYSQGSVQDPSYEDVCSGQTGHVEVVQVTYDAQQVSKSRLSVHLCGVEWLLCVMCAYSLECAELV